MRALLALALIGCGGDAVTGVDGGGADGALDVGALVADAPVEVAADVARPVFPDVGPVSADVGVDVAPDVAGDLARDVAVDLAPALDLSPPDAGTIACKGTFAGITQAQLQMAVLPSGMCRAAADVALVCTANVGTVADSCGLACASEPQSRFQGCVQTCLRGRVPLGEACAGCYAATMACTFQQCLAQCLTNPAAAACVQCQVEKGCRGAFFQCTGLPGGQAPPGDAGTD